MQEYSLITMFVKNKNTISSDIENILIKGLDSLFGHRLENNISSKLRKYLVLNMTNQLLEVIEDDLENSLNDELNINE